MTTPGRPGRPRSERARRAILTAALRLAERDGARGLSMEGIARSAAVSKETVYRWWHSKTEIVLDALAERGERVIPLADTGSLAGDLRSFLAATAAAADPATRRLLRVIAAEAATDPAAARLARDRFVATRRAALDEVLHRAVRRGELTDRHAAIAVDLIYGSLWYRLIFAVGELDGRWADAVTDAVAALAGPARPAPA